jgi:hypothetical protein
VSRILLDTSRTFALTRYIASHQQLLFRSAKGEGGADRVDVLFYAVQYINVRTVIYPDFTIFELSYDEFTGHTGGFYGSVPSSCTCYGIGGRSVEGILVADSFKEHHDDGEEWEPSAILKFDP